MFKKQVLCYIFWNQNNDFRKIIFGLSNYKRLGQLNTMEAKIKEHIAFVGSKIIESMSNRLFRCFILPLAIVAM